MHNNWLILSHAFNMDGRAASQTITDKVPYLIDAGIRLHVLSAITGIKDTRFPHQQLIAWGPSAFRFDFRHWFANRYGRGVAYKVFTPLLSVILSPLIALEKILAGYSSQWSWVFPAYFVGLRLIKEGKVDLIYSTGGAWSAHLAGLWLKKKTKLPWIAEIHDPLVIRKNEDDIGEITPKEPDAKKRHWLEREICQYADIVWWFTNGALDYAKKRNPILNTPNHAKGLSIVPGANPPTAIFREKIEDHEYKNKLCFYHFGSLAEDRSLKPIFNVLPNFFQKYPKAKTIIEFHIYGAYLDKKSKKIISQKKLSSNIVEHGRLEFDVASGLTGRQKITTLMKKADVLLLLHGAGTWCAEYIPSKLYEYIWFDRPIWGIINNNNQLSELILEREGQVSAVDDKDSIYNVLEYYWLTWSNKKLSRAKVSTISPLTAVNQIISEVYNLNAHNFNIK